jgi:hypothetical protein
VTIASTPASAVVKPQTASSKRDDKAENLYIQGIERPPAEAGHQGATSVSVRSLNRPAFFRIRFGYRSDE